MKGVEFVSLVKVTEEKPVTKVVGRVWIGDDGNVKFDIPNKNFLAELAFGVPYPDTDVIVTPNDKELFIEALPYVYAGSYFWARLVEMDTKGNVIEEGRK